MKEFESFDKVREYLLSGKTVSCKTNIYSAHYWSCHEEGCESEYLTTDEIMNWIEKCVDLKELIK